MQLQSGSAGLAIHTSLSLLLSFAFYKTINVTAVFIQGRGSKAAVKGVVISYVSNSPKDPKDQMKYAFISTVYTEMSEAKSENTLAEQFI